MILPVTYRGLRRVHKKLRTWKPPQSTEDGVLGTVGGQWKEESPGSSAAPCIRQQWRYYATVAPLALHQEASSALLVNRVRHYQTEGLEKVITTVNFVKRDFEACNLFRI